MTADNRESKATALIKQAILCDMALGFEPELEVSEKWDLLPRYLDIGFSYLGLALAGDSTSLETTIRYIARHRARIKQDNRLILVENADDILRAKNEAKLAVSFWFQGTNPLCNDLNMVDVYYRLGVRYMLLCYNTKNPVGDGCAESSDCGLSDFGRQLVEKMNQVGMLIDCSHTGYKTSMDAMELSDKPVIFSHSNVHAINPHPRNLKDDQIKACAKTGGIIGINGASILLGDSDTSPSKLVEHIDYISELVGPEHVGLGLDFIYFHSVLDLFFEKTNPGTYSKDYLSNIDPKSWASFQPEQMVALIDALLKRGYSEKNINSIVGGNFLNVVNQVWC